MYLSGRFSVETDHKCEHCEDCFLKMYRPEHGIGLRLDVRVGLRRRDMGRVRCEVRK